MKAALIVGCAANVWDDVRRAREIGEYAKTYCIKIAGIHWPEGRFTWATLHPEFMDKYEAERKALGLPGGYEIVAPLSSEVGSHGKKGNIARRVSYRWCCKGTDIVPACQRCQKKMNASASSGIYGAMVALRDGYERIVLAGIPMTKEAGHFTRGKAWEQRDCFMPGFKLALPHLLGKVKSMSGYTAEVLGEPTSEWLAS